MIEFIKTKYTEIIVVIIILLVTWLTSRLTKFLLKRFIDKYYEKLKDPTIYYFFRNISAFIIYCFGISLAIASIPEFRSYTVQLFAGAGVLAAIIGFASQQAIANIISGIFIVVFKPIRMDDLIEIENKHKGYVEDINVRHIVLRTFHNQRVVIPNSTFSAATIVNYTLHDKSICNFIEYIIEHGSNVDLALDILQNISEKHPLTIDKRTLDEIEQGLPCVTVKVINITPVGIKIRAMIWTNTPEYGYDIKFDLNHLLILAFKDANIPFAKVSTIPTHEY